MYPVVALHHTASQHAVEKGWLNSYYEMPFRYCFIEILVESLLKAYVERSSHDGRLWYSSKPLHSSSLASLPLHCIVMSHVYLVYFDRPALEDTTSSRAERGEHPTSSFENCRSTVRPETTVVRIVN